MIGLGKWKDDTSALLNFLETPDKGVIRVNDELLFDAANPVTKQESEIRKKRFTFLDLYSSLLICSRSIQHLGM